MKALMDRTGPARAAERVQGPACWLKDLMPRRWGTSRVLLLLFVWPAVAGAQAGGSAPAEVLAKATADQSRLRVRLTSGKEVELRAVGIGPGVLRGLPKGASTPVEYPLSDLDRVWRRGSAARTGLLIGAVGGAIAGAAGGAAAAEFCPVGGCSYPTDSEQLAMGAAGAVLGALIGGGLGAAIAAPIRQWRTVYQRDTRVVPVVSANRIGIALSFLPPKR